jgi:hypothetical protein
MPAASACRHPVSQSGTGALRYRTGSSDPSTGRTCSGNSDFVYFGTGLIRCRTDAGHSGIDKSIPPCTSTLQTMDWDTSCTFLLLVVERDTPCMSIRLVVEIYTPCMSIILVVVRGTPCTSTLLVVDMYTPCMSIIQVVKHGIILAI